VAIAILGNSGVAMSVNLEQGVLKLTIGTVTPQNLVIIERMKKALDDYKVKPFSLDRRATSNAKYGNAVIAIMRRYSALYPEFLEDKFFAFRFYDEIHATPGRVNYDKIGLTIRENHDGLVDTMAVVHFVQVLFQVFEMDELAFVSPSRLVEMGASSFYVTELYAVTRYKIADRGVFDWLKHQKAKKDAQANTKEFDV
jgi:hypothetical protein